MSASREPGPRPPTVLCIGGHDPSGAGIHADIETCAAFDCLALTVVTALTRQNTARVCAVQPVPAAEIAAQVELLLEDFSVHACKLGLVPTVEQVEALALLFDGPLAGCPLVIDPLLRAGSGGALVQERIETVFLARLLGHATVITPNRAEALHFGAAASPAQAAAALLARGCRAVLLTDATAGGAQIENQLYRADAPRETFAMTRYAGEYHGTGCTLATGIACELARGAPLPAAVRRAQDFVHRAVAAAWRPGSAQHLPRRHRDLLA